MLVFLVLVQLRECPGDKPTLSQGQAQVFSLFYTAEAQSVPGWVCTWDNPGDEGRKKRLDLLKVYVAFSLAIIVLDTWYFWLSLAFLHLQKASGTPRQSRLWGELAIKSTRDASSARHAARHWGSQLWELRNIYHHHPESKKRKSLEANSGSTHPCGRYENAVKN